MIFTEDSISETREEIRKGIKQGRGLGKGKGYKPWLTVNSGPAGGGSGNVPSNKTGRSMQLLSEGEQNYCKIMSFSPKVVDIREQFPLLDLDMAMKIADELGVEYPSHDGRPSVMTSDFRITLEDEDGTPRDIIRSVKQEDDLEDKRVLEKLEIERLYWQRKEGISDYKIVTWEEIPSRIAANVEFFMKRANEFERVVPSAARRKKMRKAYLARAKKQGRILSQVNEEIEREFGLEEGQGAMVFCDLAVRRKIRPDYEERTDFDQTLEEVEL